MGVVNLFVLTSGFVFLLAIAGLHNYITNFEDNGCEMTYMFEYPQYVKIFFPPHISNNFSRYALYAYGEGQFTENLRKMKFTGIPVLFIPGNSGSYKQVRSLASVSLRKGIKSHMPFHFDYFSADLNEEYSGLFGGLLEDQTEFIHQCILRILQLYVPNPNSPQSVVLIGHSMGGLLAKGLFLLPEFDARLVRVIVTLATPHAAPVALLDRHLDAYHARVRELWGAERTSSLQQVTLVSVGGGQRDVLVRSALTYAPDADVSVVSTGIPGVWLSTDHLSSLWCKELVLVIIRALFDIVDVRTKQITNYVAERKTAFEYHLVKRTAGKRLGLAYHIQEVSFDPNGHWLEYLRRQFSVVEPNGVARVTYVMIRLLDDPKHEWLLAEIINSNANDWVFACSANRIYGSSRICDVGINLSNETKLLPTSNSYKRKMVHIHLPKYKRMGFTHVVLRLLPTREMIQLNIDIHSSARNLRPSLPYMINFMKQTSVLQNSDEAALCYSLSLANFNYIWQAYYLYITPYSCRLATHHAIGIMKVPWNQEDLYIKVSELVEKPMQLRLQRPRPLLAPGNGSVEVMLVLDPSCRYSLSLKSAPLDSLGQLVRFYGPMLLPYMSAVLVLTLRSQVLSLHSSHTCTMFHSALTSGAKPYHFLPFVKIATQIVSISVFRKLLKHLIPQIDPVTIAEENLDFLLLPVFLYMTAFAMMYIAALICWLAIIFNGSAANKFALRFLAKTVTGTVTWSEWVLSGLSALPITAACLLIGLTYTTCGALSLCVGGAFFFLKLCKRYEDYLQDVFKFSVYLLSKMKAKKKEKRKEEESNKSENNEKESKAIELRVYDVAPDSVHDNTISDTEENNGMEKKVNNEKNDDEKTERSDNLSDKNIHDPDNFNQLSKQSNEEMEKTPNVEECSKDDIKENTINSNTKENEEETKKCPELGSLSVLHFNFTLLLIWIIVTLLNVPAVLVWAHNYRFSSKLRPDPSFETSVVLCFCIGILWQKQAPNPNLKYYNVVGHVLYAIAAIILIFSSLTLHYLNHLLMSVFIVLTFHQLFAGQCQESTSSVNINDTTSTTLTPYPKSQEKIKKS